MSAHGTFRTWRDVRLMSVERSEADIRQRLSTAREVPGGAGLRGPFPAPENVELRKAHAIVKTYPNLLDVEPTQVGGSDALDINNDSSEAYQKLVDMAAEQRRRSPELSDAQAFSRVFEDPANATLAAKAHRRPSPTTNYPFPR